MGMFLNPLVPAAAYKKIASSRFFVDKSRLLEEIIQSMDDNQKYICITRPRRFGKTVMANMIGAFFGKGADSRDVFLGLRIAESKFFEKHLNQHDVIYIDFSRVSKNCSSYCEYIERIQDGLYGDLAAAYPALDADSEEALWDTFQKIFDRTGKSFVFILDEWDALFHLPFVSEKEKQEYLLFLKNLFKDQIYAELVYMTGVLPITKYSSGSELNMFLEYDMATKIKYSEYFGFLDGEVDTLYRTYRETTPQPKITREDLHSWYDGYHTAAGLRIYNPRSVVCALTDNQLANYWTSSGPYDEIFYYIRGNIDAVRDDMALMTAGERTASRIRSYAAASMELKTREEIFSAMVVYGLLTYEDGYVFIPNKELMSQFQELLMTKDSLGYVHRLAAASEKMLQATLSGDTETMARILSYAHDTESPILSYNSEAELSAVVNLVYLAARDKYRVEREDRAGKGFVDFIFYPERKDEDGIILELKVDASPEEAVQQIIDKKYLLRFKGRLGEKRKFTGRILAVGISYDRKTKVHACKVEEL